MNKNFWILIAIVMSLFAVAFALLWIFDVTIWKNIVANNEELRCDECECCIQNRTDSNGVGGLYMRNIAITNKDNILKSVYETGDWVCIDVENMDINQALQTCNHEVAHHIYEEICVKEPRKCTEVFAEFCEVNMDRCLGIANGTRYD